MPQGLFLGFQTACENGSPVSFSLPGQSDTITPTFCNQRIGDVANDIAALQAEYQAATLTAGPAVNGVFIGNILSASNSGTGTNMFAPDYKTARSVQMNLGFQHEFGKGIVWSADFVRNIGTRNLLAVDVNHVGDASHLDTPAALAAINSTILGNEHTNDMDGVTCPLALSAGSSSQTAVQCYIANVQPASISDFAANAGVVAPGKGMVAWGRDRIGNHFHSAPAAIDTEQLPRLEDAGGLFDAHDCRDSVLPGHYGAVGQQSPFLDHDYL